MKRPRIGCAEAKGVGTSEAVRHVTSAPDLEVLRQALARVLVTTLRGAQLGTLTLGVRGMPGLSRTVAADAGGSGQLTLWIESTDIGDWHEGLVLVATAADAGQHRRSVVRDAVVLIDELIVSDRRRFQAELLAQRAIELAGVDALTELGNRRAWRRALDEEAARVVRYGAETAVAVIDLDGLKAINDTLGHAAGDQHLRKAATALHAAARSVDVVCRLGGDEFAVLAPETGAGGGSMLGSRLLQALADAGVQASIGVATATDGQLDGAWQEADSAMYRNKKQRALVGSSVG